MMDLLFIGASRRHGIGKTGNAYDMAFVKYASLQGFESKTSEKNTFVAYGQQEQEIELDPSIIDKFRNAKFGDTVKVDLGPNPMNMQRNRVTNLLEINGKKLHEIVNQPSSVKS